MIYKSTQDKYLLRVLLPHSARYRNLICLFVSPASVKHFKLVDVKTLQTGGGRKITDWWI